MNCRPSIAQNVIPYLTSLFLSGFIAWQKIDSKYKKEKKEEENTSVSFVL